jgi:hypothetical protein
VCVPELHFCFGFISGVDNGCSAELERRTLSEFSKRDLEN